MPANQSYVPAMAEVLAYLDAATCAWASIDPEDIIRAVAELTEKKRIEAVSEQNLGNDTGAIWVSEQHGRYVAEPGYITPDTSVYRNWQRYVPADTVAELDNVYIAYLQHSPEDLAIGVGCSEEEAIEGLHQAYPPAFKSAVAVTLCPPGLGYASLADAPVIAGTSP